MQSWVREYVRIPGTIPMSIILQIEFIANVVRDAQIKYSSASQGRALPGKFASGQLAVDQSSQRWSGSEAGHLGRMIDSP